MMVQCKLNIGHTKYVRKFLRLIKIERQKCLVNLDDDKSIGCLEASVSENKYEFHVLSFPWSGKKEQQQKYTQIDSLKVRYAINYNNNNNF